MKPPPVHSDLLTVHEMIRNDKRRRSRFIRKTQYYQSAVFFNYDITFFESIKNIFSMFVVVIGLGIHHPGAELNLQN